MIWRHMPKNNQEMCTYVIIKQLFRNPTIPWSAWCVFDWFSILNINYEEVIRIICLMRPHARWHLIITAVFSSQPPALKWHVLQFSQEACCLHAKLPSRKTLSGKNVDRRNLSVWVFLREVVLMHLHKHQFSRDHLLWHPLQAQHPTSAPKNARRVAHWSFCW